MARRRHAGQQGAPTEGRGGGGTHQGGEGSGKKGKFAPEGPQSLNVEVVRGGAIGLEQVIDLVLWWQFNDTMRDSPKGRKESKKISKEGTQNETNEGRTQTK
jgi:hypothetical protein